MLPRRVLIRCDLIISTLPIRVGIPLIPLTGSWQSFERDHQCVRSECQLRRKGSDIHYVDPIAGTVSRCTAMASLRVSAFLHQF